MDLVADSPVFDLGDSSWAAQASAALRRQGFVRVRLTPAELRVVESVYDSGLRFFDDRAKWQLVVGDSAHRLWDSRSGYVGDRYREYIEMHACNRFAMDDKHSRRGRPCERSGSSRGLGSESGSTADAHSPSSRFLPSMQALALQCHTRCHEALRELAGDDASNQVGRLLAEEEAAAQRPAGEGEEETALGFECSMMRVYRYNCCYDPYEGDVHHDMGLLTMIPKSSSPGLEIQPEHGGGEWVRVEKLLGRDEAIIFGGVTLARLTGVRALRHRIYTGGRVRISACYFQRTGPGFHFDAAPGFEAETAANYSKRIRDAREEELHADGIIRPQRPSSSSFMSAIGRASASASGRTADSPRVTLDTRLTLDEVSRRMPLLPPMQGTELAPSGRTLLSPSLAAAIRLACLISLCAFCSGYCSGYIHHTHHHHAPDAPTAPPVPPSPPPSAPSSGLEPLPDWFFEAWGPVAATGALSCAWSLSALGRRTALLLAASFFALSAALRAIFDLPGAGEDTPETERLAGTWGLAAGYSLQWLAQGMSSAIVPLYVAEISPVTHRGALVGLGVFFLWAGAAVSYVAWIFLDGGCVAPPCDDALPYGRSLRCAGLLIPAALLAFGLCRGHDTPRSALRLGRLTEARESLRSLRGGKHADLAGIEAELDFMLSVGDSSGGSGSGNTETDGTGRGVGRGGGAKGCWALCRSGRALLLGIGLQVVTPLSFGIYMLVLEQDHERREAQHDHFHTSGIVSAISCLAALLVVLVVDRVGRRRLLAISCLTMAASALGIAGCWTNGDTVWQSEGMRWALFFVYAASTFAGVIFVPQLTLVEIYSSEASASGVSISMCCFWLALTAVLTFSPLLDVWQHAYISAGQVVLLLLMTTAVPETARRPLDSHLYGWITATSRPS